MSAKSNSLWKDARKWLPGVLISIVAVAVLFRLARWQDLKLAFASIQPIYFAGAALLTFISLGTRAQAWRTLLENRTTFRKAFLIVNEGYMLNNLFPLRAGEIGRAVFMGQVTGLGPFHVLSTIVIERIFDLAMAAALLLATLPLALEMAWAKPVAIVTLALVIIGLTVMYLAARNHEKVHGWIVRFSPRWGFFQKLIIPQLDSLLNGLAVLRRPSQFVLSFLWIAASWALWVLMYYLMLLPIAPGAPLWWAMFTDGVLAMGIAIPSAPGALGVYEASVVAALGILGISASAALAYAITMHFIQFVLTGIFGFIGLLQDGRSLGNLFSELRIQQQQNQSQSSNLE